MAKLLFVEDDVELAELVKAVLVHERFTVEHVTDGKSGLERALCSSFSLIILDLQLPLLSGLDLCTKLRESDKTTPVLMLTGKVTVDDKTCGLDTGADDYLTKPFSTRELLARIRALLRRSAGINSNVVKYGDLELDLSTGRILKGLEELELNPREYALLEFFLRNPNQLFSTDALLNNVWETDSEQSVGALRACITRIRKKIDHPGRQSLIRSLNRVGYMLDSDYSNPFSKHIESQAGAGTSLLR